MKRQAVVGIVIGGIAVVAGAVASPLAAQQVSGTPCSASATIIIDGELGWLGTKQEEER